MVRFIRAALTLVALAAVAHTGVAAADENPGMMGYIRRFLGEAAEPAPAPMKEGEAPQVANCGGPPECAKYDQIACEAEKPLGCFWTEPAKDTDVAPAPKPMEGGTGTEPTFKDTADSPVTVTVTDLTVTVTRLFAVSSPPLRRLFAASVPPP